MPFPQVSVQGLQGSQAPQLPATGGTHAWGRESVEHKAGIPDEHIQVGCTANWSSSGQSIQNSFDVSLTVNNKYELNDHLIFWIS